MNAVGECLSNSEMPNEAKDVCTSSPVHKPKEVAIPARLPDETLWVITNTISGPGAIVKSIATVRNDSKL